MIICVDFDGTIVDHRYPDIGQPVPGALEWLRHLSTQGAQLVLFTMRGERHLEQAVRFLLDNEVKLHGINRTPGQELWTGSPKAYGDVYVDDAAFGCPLCHPEGFARPCVDWSVVGPALVSRLEQL